MGIFDIHRNPLTRTFIKGLVIGGLLFSAAPQAQEVVSDRQYGRVLFHYFQGDYQGALTQLAIAESRGGIQHQGLSPELLKGGISLGFGLEQQALSIFSQLLNDDVAPHIQAQAWFSLAKVMYSQGDYQAGLSALGYITQPMLSELNAASLQEYHYLQAQLLVATGQLEQLDNSLNALNQRTIYVDYLNYNLALQWQQQQQTEQAISVLQQIDQRQYAALSTGMLGNWRDSWLNAWFDWQPVTTDASEQQALQDRVNVTLGYLQMQNQDYPQAIRAFKSVRLDGLDAQWALLGYGFAAMELQDFQQAISLWQVLQQQPQNSRYKQQSRLAVASAYQSLNAPVQALSELQSAVQHYQQEMQALDDTLVRLQQADYFVPYIQQVQQNGEFDISASADTATQHRLLTVFSSAEFSQQMMALADLHALGDELQRWQKQLQSYRLMVNEREQLTLNRAAMLQQNNLLNQLGDYQVQRQQLAERIAHIEQQQNGHALLAAEPLSQHQQLLAAQDRMQRIQQQQPLAASYQQRLKRLSGILSWQADSNFVDNLWQAKQALAELDAAIEQTQQRRQMLIVAMDQQPQFAQQRQRIRQLADKVAVQTANYQQTYSNFMQALIDDASLVVMQEKQQLQGLLVHAQVEIVRLQDQAYQALDRQTPNAEVNL